MRRADTEDVDWRAVRGLFRLSREWTHLAAFYLSSHPAPVADAIERFRRRIDDDPFWIEEAVFGEGRDGPYRAVKSALAGYLGGAADEICLTSSTTAALAVAYHGLRIREDQEIVTTEHDHYSHHESIRYAAARSGCAVRYVRLYERPAHTSADEIVDRLSRAVRPRTRAVGITWVHSSTGVKIPIGPIADAVARANRGRLPADRCLLIVDGVHGLGSQNIEVVRLGCDLFAAGAHKWLCAPRGTGFLWGRADAWPELRPTIPTFDPDADGAWHAWMDRTALPPTRASFVSPGGFTAFEHVLAIPAAVELHRTLGRDRVAARIHALNDAFREGAGTIRGLVLHTPRDPELSAGISAFELAGMTAAEVAARLAARRIRTSISPYKVCYARVAAGIMNGEEDIELVLRALRRLASGS